MRQKPTGSTSPISITPETNHSIHYWWFNTRDQRLNDFAADAFLQNASEQAYREDVDALEWIADVVKKDAQPQFDLNFAPDKPALLMRRVLFDLAEAERRGL